MLTTLKFKDLVKLYTSEEDALKQAILNLLNRKNDLNKRRCLYVKSLIEYDDYYRVEVVYEDDFIWVQMKDIGIYFIQKEEV